MKQISKWEKLTNQITASFIRDYWDVEEDEELDYSWMGGNIGGIFEFADMFINFSDVLNCYKYKVSKKQFHEWYWFCLENQFVNISLAKFILSPEEKYKKEVESLQKSKESCTFAEETFNKDLENYDRM